MRREHGEDSGFADEIVEAFTPVAAGAAPGNPEMLGYMLRGFFQNCRRHLAWDRDYILPEANERLTRGDLLELENKMRVHRADRELSARFRRERHQEIAGGNE
jgi:hemerythrin-like domain-containing protein